MHKLPQITLAFWIMKICATTLGETAGDLLSMTLHIGYAFSSLLLLGIFLGMFAAQLAVNRFHPVLFWTVILSTSTAGTTISDYIDRTLHLGYPLGSTVLLALLGSVLILWKYTEGSLALTSIRTRQAELFYWVAILLSNTLGTAMGDFLADSSALGFAGGAALVSGLIALIVGLHYTNRVSQVALFWAAFVLTRPLGATLGDLLTKTSDKGGMGFGTIGTSAVLFTVLAVLIVTSGRKPMKAPV